MASSGKRKTTMAKLTRERRLMERRLDKQARKEARKRAALAGDAPAIGLAFADPANPSSVYAEREDGGTMDEATTRSHIEAHADSVVRGDTDAILADFAEELRPQVPQLAQALPQPTTSADIQDIEIGQAESVSTIRYSGEDAAVTIRAQWQDQDGRPVIVHAEAVG